MQQNSQFQPHQTPDFVDVPIDDGSNPQWETRLGYPKLFNMFIGEENKAYCSPGLLTINQDYEFKDVRALIKTTFDKGAYILVTDDNILKVKLDGDTTIIHRIRNTRLPVQMSENLQNQIGIVDGLNFYVIDQRSGNFVTVMGEDEGFTFKSPISITVLNSFAVVLDLNTGGWAISEPNQMKVFPPLDNVSQISSSLTQASTLETLDDNLFIFGTTGIERWVPSSTNNQYLFPFSKDNNFRVDFGSISVNGAERGFGKIYFLSSKFIPMMITGRGTESQDIGAPGMARVIASYPDADEAQGSFYTYEDNFFFCLYFPVSKISWIYCENSGKWSNGDDNITCAVPRTNVVANPEGLFELVHPEVSQTSKLREWQSRRMKTYKGTQSYRELLNSIEAQLIQGFIQSSEDEPQELRLKISLDSQSWENSVTAYIGETGDRNDLTIWRCNIAAKEYTLNIQYQGTYNFTIDRVAVILK